MKKSNSKLIKLLICVVVVLSVLLAAIVIGTLLLRDGGQQGESEPETEPDTMNQDSFAPTWEDLTTTAGETSPGETGSESPGDTQPVQSGGTVNVSQNNQTGGNSQSSENNQSGGGGPTGDHVGSGHLTDGTSSESTAVVDSARLSEEALELVAWGGYSGNYVEDGSDELVSNVAAILVKNLSGDMLQVAQIQFQVNETEMAWFQIANLPAGESALALELNRRQFSSGDDYSYGKTASSFLGEPSVQSDRVKLDTGTAGQLTLENISSETLAKVYVYYKYVQQDGTYLGGITYRVPFENVEPGGSVTVTAGHFDPENSRVLDIQIRTE